MMICIFSGIGSLALTMIILVGGQSLLRGIPPADGIKDFWYWAIAAMAGFSCGYLLWHKDRDHKDRK